MLQKFVKDRKECGRVSSRSQPTGRREISWDGGPEAVQPFDMPADFFNTAFPRGITFSTPGTGFQISGTNGNPLDVEAFEEFGNINSTYSSTFRTFSSEEIFTTLGSNILDYDFFVQETDTPAVINGLGIVFTDVDLANTTKIEFFGIDEELLWSGFAPAVPDSNESLSFLGVSFDTVNVFKVRITSGNTPLSADTFDGNGIDLVALDDHIFGEPQPAVAVPEPSAVGSFLLSILATWSYWRKKHYSCR